MTRLSDWNAGELAKRLSKPGAGRSHPSSGGWIAPCPAHDDRKPSLSLTNASDGKLLYHCFGGCSADEVRLALLAVLGGEQPEAREEGEDRQREKVEDPRRTVIPVPAEAAVTIDDFVHTIHGTPKRVWTYRTLDGGIAGWVARYDVGDGEKEVVPFVWTRHEMTGREEMRMRAMPDPRPLYNLDKIADSGDAIIVMNEGEKAADAAAKMFPDWVATAIPGGSSAARLVDLTPLSGRTVVLLADHDGPGYEFALKMQERMPVTTMLHMIAWPRKWPASAGGGDYELKKGWDADDHLGNGWTRDLIRERMTESGDKFVHRLAMLPRPFEQIHYIDTKPS